MISFRISFQGVALLFCLLAASVSHSNAEAQSIDAGHQHDDPSYGIHRNLLAAMKPEKQMIKYCSIQKNRKTKACITWAQGHFNTTVSKAELAKYLRAKSCPKKSRAGSIYTPYDATIGNRVAQISSALRCKWEKIIDWTCTTCMGVPNYKVLTAYQTPSADPDGFIVGFDQQLNAVVLTFRSTYCATSADCISLQWLNNFLAFAKTITLPTGSYRVHSGIHDTWATGLKSQALQALKDAFALYPAASHNGLYVTGHSRGGALAVLAAIDLSFEAANLGLTAPTEQMKLYTMGSLRVGDTNYAALVENLFTTRWRMVSNADIVTQVPPVKIDWIDNLLFLLGDLGKTLVNLGNTINFYRHYGPTALLIDTTATKAVKICPDGECSDCFAAGLATIALGRTWADSILTRVMMDHQWYAGADMDNANCKMNGRNTYNPIIYD